MGVWDVTNDAESNIDPAAPNDCDGANGVGETLARTPRPTSTTLSGSFLRRAATGDPNGVLQALCITLIFGADVPLK